MIHAIIPPAARVRLDIAEQVNETRLDVSTHIDAADMCDSDTLYDLGLDDIDAVEIAHHIERRTRIALPDAMLDRTVRGRRPDRCGAADCGGGRVMAAEAQIEAMVRAMQASTPPVTP